MPNIPLLLTLNNGAVAFGTLIVPPVIVPPVNVPPVIVPPVIVPDATIFPLKVPPLAFIVPETVALVAVKTPAGVTLNGASAKVAFPK